MTFLLHHLLKESVRLHPDRVALAFGDVTLTYGELDRATNSLAHLLISVGIGKGDRIGILLHRGIDSIIAAIGCLKAGAIYVPMDPASPGGRMRFITHKCRVSVVVTAQEGLVLLEQAYPGESPLGSIVLMDGHGSDQRPPGLARLVDWGDVPKDDDREPPDARVVDTDTAYVLFTSGSTGTPKGVRISHLNALSFVNAAQGFFQITETDRLSSICPLHFDMSVFDIYVAIKAGACVVGISETDAMFPAKMAEAIARGRISVWNSVPSALALLADLRNLETYDLSSLRLILFAGEVFPLKPLRRLQAAVPGARFCNMYGQTEANSSTYFWVGPLPDDSRAPVPIGRPLPNFDVFALDDDGRRVVDTGREGELYVRASTVAMGYWEEPEKTAAAFVVNPLEPDTHERVYRTGDLVRLDDDGNYVFVGRKDLMIKRRGYRIEIGESKSVLLGHPGIRNVVVIAIPDDRVGNRLSVLVEPSVPGSLTEDDILGYCVAELPRYMVPDVIGFAESLPLTASGKVDRMKLAAP